MGAKRGEPIIKPGSLRIDQFLWRIRFAKSRSQAQKLIQQSPIRLNGRRVERDSSLVRADDIITMPRGEEIIAMRIIALPVRRGPAREAQNYYEILIS